MTAALALDGVELGLGEFRLRGLDLALAAGEILVLLGPNGAGKSVTLETIAGFHRPARGRILVAGRDVTGLPPEHRGVGFVVQDFGLFPHLSVARNVAFARPAAEIGPLLAQFGIAALADRLPRDLSLGERQRTALARALAGRPRLFLFDEPFSALDARSRAALRGELKAQLRATGLAAVFVTHDPEDACVLADRLAVMRAGAIVQTGSVDDVLRRPGELWIAQFVGIENILPGHVGARSPEGCRIAVGGATLSAPGTTAGEEVLACIRAEEVELRPPAEAGPGWLCGRVTAVARLGATERVTLDCGFPLQALATARQVRELRLCAGAEVAARIAREAVHLLPAESGR